MNKITFSMCKNSKYNHFSAVRLIRKERIALEHQKIFKDSLRMKISDKTYGKFTYGDDGLYCATHEIAAYKAFTYIGLDKFKNGIDIGGGLNALAGIMSTFMNGEICSIEVDKELHSEGKTLMQILKSSLPMLNRIKMIRGDFLKSNIDLKKYDVIFHSANLSFEAAKDLSAKIAADMRPHAILILTYLSEGINFFIDNKVLHKIKEDFTWFDIGQHIEYTFNYYIKTS